MSIVDPLTVTSVAATPPTVTVAPALKFEPVMVIGVPPSVVPLAGVMDDTVSVVGWVGELARAGRDRSGEDEQKRQKTHGGILPDASTCHVSARASRTARLELADAMIGA